MLILDQVELILRFLGHVYIPCRLRLQVQVDVIEHFLCAEVHALHRTVLEDQLRRLPDEELSHGHKLLLREALVAIVDLRWSIRKACYLEQLSVVLDIFGAVQALLVKLEVFTSWLSLLPDALVHVCRLIQFRLKHAEALLSLAIVAFHDTL